MSDLISRQAVNKLVDELARAISDEKCHIQRGRNYGRIMHDILELPSVEPEQNLQPTCNQLATDCISRQAAEEKLKKVVDEMALIFADIREKNVDDSVCGLCEYDCDHGIDGYANECPGFERDDCFKLKEEYQKEWTNLSNIPSVEPERKLGKWIENKKTPGYTKWNCSECGLLVRNTQKPWYEYCPKCGADMEGGVTCNDED